LVVSRTAAPPAPDRSPRVGYGPGAGPTPGDGSASAAPEQVQGPSAPQAAPASVASGPVAPMLVAPVTAVPAADLGNAEARGRDVPLVSRSSVGSTQGVPSASGGESAGPEGPRAPGPALAVARPPAATNDPAAR